MGHGSNFRDYPAVYPVKRLILAENTRQVRNCAVARTVTIISTVRYQKFTSGNTLLRLYGPLRSDLARRATRLRV